MDSKIRIHLTSGIASLKAQVTSRDGLVFDGASSMVASSTLSDAQWLASLVTMTEDLSSDATNTGWYLAAFPAGLTALALYGVTFFDTPSGPAARSIGTQVDPTDFASSELYHAEISLAIDEANTQDEWTVSWSLNGQPITTGITVPKIKGVKRTDGLDLFANVAMAEVGSTQTFKHDTVTTERMTAGEAVIVTATATIDGATRTWPDIKTRDSS